MGYKNKEDARAYQRKYRETHKPKRYAATKAWQDARRPHVREQARKRYAEDAEYRARVIKESHEWRLKNLYDTTPEEYQQMYDEQGGKCALPSCLNPAEVLDHNHFTKKRRGLLCKSHNLGLGKFHDNPTLLREAAEYLECRK